MIELDFRPGAILAEEFAFIVESILTLADDQDSKIRRIVLLDVSMIGSSYPFLRESSTTGQLFLSALTHLTRNRGVDFVMSGTLGDLPEANEGVNRAATLADVNIVSRYQNVFGQRHIVVRNAGHATKSKNAASKGEALPASVKWQEKGKNGPVVFSLDHAPLEGLVGFESNNIRRPGIVLHLFSQYGKGTDENKDTSSVGKDEPRDSHESKNKRDIHAQYNRSLETMLRSAFGRDLSLSKNCEGSSGEQDVIVRAFGSSESESVHDFLKVLGGRPLDRTIVYALDEFSRNEHRGKDTLAALEKVSDSSGDAQEDTSDQEKESACDHNVPPKPSLYIVKTESSKKCEKEDAPAIVRPYYANVLLLAYRKDILEKCSKNDKVRMKFIREGSSEEPPLSAICIESWEEVVELSKVIFAKRDKCARPVSRAVCYDQCSETFSCALLDAIAAGLFHERIADFRKDQKDFLKGNPKDEFGEKICEELYKTIKVGLEANGDEVQQSFYTEDVANQVARLQEFWHLSQEPSTEELEIMDQGNIPNRPLLPDAGVYLCWYSQLRDLINNHPHLAEKIQVASLPGCGFRGDWYLGIAGGSVSKELGEEVLEILCSKNEEFKRFELGVGLPTLQELYGCATSNNGISSITPFYAWHRALHVDLRTVLAIHQMALSRSDIEKYVKYRGALSTISRQMTPEWGEAMGAEQLATHVARLQHHLNVL